jgi:hypothetical protein
MDKLKLIEAILGAQCAEPNINEEVFAKGEKLLIATVTRYWTGRVVGTRGKFLLIDDAAWIPDTGRFSDAVRIGELSEVEPVEGVVRLNMDSFVDVVTWAHALPRERK